jgi:hypothetical protein
MLGSPLHSSATPISGVISCAVGVSLVVYGKKIISKREIQIRRGGRGGPLEMVEGKEAVHIGQGILLFGMFWIAIGVLGLLQMYGWI